MQQQTFYCPICKGTVAYGQPYCARCNTMLAWPGMQTPPQNPPAQNQYAGQQQWGQQSQYGQQSAPGQQQWDQQQQQQQRPARPQRPPAQGSKMRKEGSQPGLWQEIIKHKSAVIKIVVALAVIALLIGVFSSFQGEIAKLVSKPVINVFQSSADTITEGEETNLRWDVAGTSSVTITPGIGAVAASGSKAVTPGKTTTYTLVAKNNFGTVQQEVTIKVTGKLPVISSFSASSTNIIAGQSVKLTWNVTGATSVSINPTVGSVAPSGSQNVSPTMTTTYTLTAGNEAGNITKAVSVTVTASDVPVITTFTATPSSIKAGQSATLSWDVIGSTSININQGIGGVGAKGEMTVQPAATTTYTLTAGGVTKSVTITVDTSSVQSTSSSSIPTSAPVINSFTVDKSSITLGDNVTLSWVVTGAKSVSISPNIGSVSLSGSAVVIPIGDTTYTLTATNNLGTVTDNVTVSTEATGDEQIPVISDFTATPASVSSGGTVRLSWNILRAKAIAISPYVEMPESKFQNYQDVTVTENTTYTLTAINSGGAVTRSVTVTVH